VIHDAAPTRDHVRSRADVAVSAVAPDPRGILTVAQRSNRVTNARTGAVVATRIDEAGNPWQAFKGLMFRKSLSPGHGMLFRPARGIHTHFMRFPIDLIFLDEHDRVVKIRPAMQPWRVDFTNARAVIEMNAGAAAEAGLQPGDQLVFSPG
jgi:uncharacterized protein